MKEVNDIKTPKEQKEINPRQNLKQVEENQYNNEIKNKKNKVKKSRIKTKIYLNEITPELIEEIQNSSEEIEPWEKIIIMLAICDKTKNINRAKQIVSQSKELEGLNKKDLNKIMNQIESKRNIFDFYVYDKILGWELDEKLLDENRKMSQENTKMNHKKEEKKVTPIIKNQPTKSSFQLKYEISEKITRKNRIKEEKIQPENKKEEFSLQETAEKKITYEENKKSIESEIRKIKEIQKEIYVILQSKDGDEQRKALKLWDMSENKLDRLKKQLSGQDRE